MTARAKPTTVLYALIMRNGAMGDVYKTKEAALRNARKFAGHYTIQMFVPAPAKRLGGVSDLHIEMMEAMTEEELEAYEASE
jgi:hypothetical protein